MKKVARIVGVAVFLVCIMAIAACDEPHTHVFGEWSVTTAASCTAEGAETRECACGETETRPVAKSAHDYGAAELMIEDGVAYSVKTCADCPSESKTVDEDIMALADEITFVATATELTSAMAEGGYIVVYGDITSEGNFTVDGGQSVTVHLLPGVTVAGNGCDGVFYITNGTLTLNGEGVVKSNVCVDDGYSMAMWASGESAKIIVNGNTYENDCLVGEEQNDLIYAKNSAEIVINGGSFKAISPNWTLNLADRTNAVISVKGGKFYGFNPAEADTEPASEETNGVYSFVADGFTVSETEENGVTVYTVIAE